MMKPEYRATSTDPYHVSAGGVVYTMEDNEPLLAILYRERENSKTYHLPKGTVKLREPLINAAIREVKEEAGLEVKPVAYIGATTRTWTHPRKNIYIDKTCHYYLFQAMGEAEVGMDDEHDGLLWATVSEAKRLLETMKKGEAKLIDRSMEYLN